MEDLVPGSAEYTLEVSSPGIERRLYRAEDYTRFSGFLVEVKLFAPVAGKKKLVGRMSFAENVVTLDLAAAKPKGKGKKKIDTATETIDLPLSEIELAHLVAEI